MAFVMYSAMSCLPVKNEVFYVKVLNRFLLKFLSLRYFLKELLNTLKQNQSTIVNFKQFLALLNMTHLEVLIILHIMGYVLFSSL